MGLGKPFTGSVTPGQFRLRSAIASFGHSLQFDQRQTVPEALGMADQLQRLSGTTLNQLAFQRLSQQTWRIRLCK